MSDGVAVGTNDGANVGACVCPGGSGVGANEGIGVRPKASASANATESLSARTMVRTSERACGLEEVASEQMNPGGSGVGANEGIGGTDVRHSRRRMRRRRMSRRRRRHER
eukprot:TRINITY_DN5717_c0_g1_i16.p4 TRINITY_DN5717_c0_g1~~TRINITY_DN5717_c0_g1_i16.p4  ORF type:complete len:111 (-),score=15.17 TRINITY_DN5717_c0_g1_i16:137-469(-)